MKYKYLLPLDPEQNLGEDKFVIEMWDFDLMGNDLIGRGVFDLNTHNMLKKAYKRKDTVKLL